MKSILARLYALQQLDSQLQAIHGDPLVETMSQQIVELEKRGSVLEEERGELQGEVREKNRQIKRTDHAEQSMGERRKELEEEMYSGRVGAKELGQIQRKINNLKDQKESLGDHLLQLLEEVEILEEKEEDLKERIRQLQEERREKEEALSQRKKENMAQQMALKKEKDALFDKIGEEYLAIYQEVKENRGGVAVVCVDGSYCLGCRVELPATIIDKLHGSDELVYCGSCKRVLFLKKG